MYAGRGTTERANLFFSFSFFVSYYLAKTHTLKWVIVYMYMYIYIYRNINININITVAVVIAVVVVYYIV